MTAANDVEKKPKQA